MQEAQAKDSIMQLKAEIANLTRLAEAGSALSSGEEAALNELMKQKEELTRERDTQVGGTCWAGIDYNSSSCTARHSAAWHGLAWQEIGCIRALLKHTMPNMQMPAVHQQLCLSGQQSVALAVMRCSSLLQLPLLHT